jgi:hypothetical protein
VTSWLDPDRDDGYDKYEREDPVSVEEAYRELEDKLERPYGMTWGRQIGASIKHRTEKTFREWNEERFGPYRCTDCGKVNEDGGACDFCKAPCRRQAFL